MNTCIDGNLKCALGGICARVQMHGDSAFNILRSQRARRRDCVTTPPLGPGQYDLVIVGDMPATEDVYRDIFFQDNAGEMILDFLQKTGHDLRRVWMTKAVKCRPVNKKRKPSTQEVNACRDEHLLNEIAMLQPKAVMLVGAGALRTFNLIGMGSINSIHGRVFELKLTNDVKEEGPTYNVIPTISPGQFFYRPNDKLKARVQHDYVVAKDVIDGKAATEHYTPEWTLVDTPEKLAWLEEKLSTTNLFGWDTETCHLGFKKAPLLCFSFAWGWDECAVLPIRQHDPTKVQPNDGHSYWHKDGFGILNYELVKGFLSRVFENPNIQKAAHNMKWDHNVLRYNFGITQNGFLYDTMVMKHLMDENPPSDLEFLCDLEFAWGDYSATKRKITGSGKKLRAYYCHVPDEILWPYAATDALGTYRLACLYYERLNKRPNLWSLYVEESEPVMKTLAKAEYKGGLIDMGVRAALHTEWEQEQAALLTNLQAQAWPEFNPKAPEQVYKAFLNMGVPDVDLDDQTKARGHSTDKKTLMELAEEGKQPQAKFSEDLMVYRNRSKMISTYLENVLVDIDTDGRLRHSWRQAGPVTGRLSCTFYHQVPKIDEERVALNKLVMRDMMIAPKGWKYVYGDFSQVELRILAILAQDEEMLKIMMDPNGDLHRATAFEFLQPVWPGLTEVMISKKNRTEVGKRINFGLAYGSEGHALVKTGKWYDVNNVERQFTWDMLNAGMVRWKTRFSGVGHFIDYMPDLVRSYNGTATNVFGRERHFGTVLNAANDWERQAAERECINYFIQSVAGNLTNRMIIAIDRVLESQGVDEESICLVNTVHDSMAYEVREEYVEWFQQVIEALSSVPVPQLFNNTFRVDVGVGQSWREAEMS